jgi:dihydroxyacetone kinase-like protein
MKAQDLTGLFAHLSRIMDENRKYLIKLDSVVGDSDLGLTMGDGFKAAHEAIADGAIDDIGKYLYAAGKAMSTAVPSTMGTLMASGWMQAGKVWKGRTEISFEELPELFAAYQDGVANRGKAKVGEKTFLDGWAPAVEAMKQAVAEGKTPAEMAALGAEAAEQGFHDTTNMVAVHGRAATRGEESRTLEDPGAAVAMLMMRACRDWVDEQTK